VNPKFYEQANRALPAAPAAPVTVPAAPASLEVK